MEKCLSTENMSDEPACPLFMCSDISFDLRSCVSCIVGRVRPGLWMKHGQNERLTFSLGPEQVPQTTKEKPFTRVAVAGATPGNRCGSYGLSLPCLVLVNLEARVHVCVW